MAAQAKRAAEKGLTLDPNCFGTGPTLENYFNAAGAAATFHVSPDITWALCSNNNSFGYNSDVADERTAIYPAILGAGVRVLIYNGEADLCVPWTDNGERRRRQAPPAAAAAGGRECAAHRPLRRPRRTPASRLRRMSPTAAAPRAPLRLDPAPPPLQSGGRAPLRRRRACPLRTSGRRGPSRARRATATMSVATVLTTRASSRLRLCAAPATWCVQRRGAGVCQARLTQPPPYFSFPRSHPPSQVPETRPEAALTLLKTFISGTPL